MKIGFLGFGNMAQAMAKGLILTEAVQPADIYACAKHWDKLCGNTQPQGMLPCKSAEEMIPQVDLVVIAIKPYLIPKVVPQLHDLLIGKIVISVAAGYTYEKFSDLLGDDIHLLCTVPNTPISVGEGIIVCEDVHSLTPEEFSAFQAVFSRAALIQPVESRLLSTAGTVAGCSPAFISMFLEALGDAGVKHGLPRALAYRLAGQVICGTGKLHVMTGTHPGAMKDAVCSPGGTTIRGSVHSNSTASVRRSSTPSTPSRASNRSFSSPIRTGFGPLAWPGFFAAEPCLPWPPGLHDLAGDRIRRYMLESGGFFPYTEGREEACVIWIFAFCSTS